MIENGTNRYPTVDTLHKIAEGLDIDPTPLCDAAWAEHTAPVPSLRAYIHRRYDISADKLAALEALLADVPEHSTHDIEAA